MLEIIEYIFSSFWRWLGMLFYLAVIFGSITGVRIYNKKT